MGGNLFVPQRELTDREFEKMLEEEEALKKSKKNKKKDPNNSNNKIKV